VLIFVGSQFSEAHRKWRYCMAIGKQQFVGNCATLVVRGNVPLTINIVLSERVTEISAVVRKQ
jgi:hypothetical protein